MSSQYILEKKIILVVQSFRASKAVYCQIILLSAVVSVIMMLVSNIINHQNEFRIFVVFRKEPSQPPSMAQYKIIQAAAEENYMSSLKRLVKNWPFDLLIVTYGMN